jgi:5-methylcytosine-specific restriction enzyme A
MAKLLRGCLDCRTLVRGKSRCVDCQRKRDQAKAKARPDLHNDRTERERRRRAVATWRATMGDWCPGVPELGRPAHPAANLQADHAIEVAAGGPAAGPLVVRCGPCNSARSANVRRAADAALGFPIGAARTTPAQANGRLHPAPPDNGPVVA